MPLEQRILKCTSGRLIDVISNDDLALSPNDYTPISESLTIVGTIDQNNANTQVSFNIATRLDNLNELDKENLNVIGTVTSTNVGAQDLNKVATILDIDPDPLVAIDSVKVEEGNSLKFTISLLNASLEIMENYLPINFSLETIDDTTISSEDYEQILKSTSIPAYTSSISQAVITKDDKINEDTEAFFLQANISTIGVSNTFPPRGIGLIKDNDYPNLFSPNGDGKSDYLKISGLEDYPDFKLVIFNRSGNEVYKYSNNGALNPLWWNGNYNGNPAPAGVYYYTLEFNDGTTKPITNFIQLIR